MAVPATTTVTIDDIKFNAITVHVGLSTVHDDSGMPAMGSTRCAVECVVDMHDNVNMPYASLQRLFELAKVVTRDKIKDIKIEFWQDESRQDALCTYSFKGWLSSFSTGSGGGMNHTLSMSIQPALDMKNFIDLKMGN
ncbi:hypothetical protein [Granulicella arctica]|uniref:Uncharacterized protein n=1 Tax=Granulicella arctica TaxID=940613 RepID=A0A7Y9PF66_9BACT|nr:hypothetical protein [Granulicella arctica]NYF78800.1 hypothetical protein [Granulicella arctica]